MTPRYEQNSHSGTKASEARAVVCTSVSMQQHAQRDADEAAPTSATPKHAAPSLVWRLSLVAFLCQSKSTAPKPTAFSSLKLLARTVSRRSKLLRSILRVVHYHGPCEKCSRSAATDGYVNKPKLCRQCVFSPRGQSNMAPIWAVQLVKTPKRVYYLCKLSSGPFV